jgi:hypothetical protein
MAMGHVEMSADAWRCRCVVAVWQHGDRFLIKTKTKKKEKKKEKKNKNTYFNKIERNLDKLMEEGVEKWLPKLMKMSFG